MLLSHVSDTVNMSNLLVNTVSFTGTFSSRHLRERTLRCAILTLPFVLQGHLYNNSVRAQGWFPHHVVIVKLE